MNGRYLAAGLAVVPLATSVAYAQGISSNSAGQASTLQAPGPTSAAAGATPAPRSAAARNVGASLDGQGARLDEVVVTATRTGETKAQRTPVAITVFSADKLNSALVTNVKDLVQLTPNLSVAQTTASAQIYIRGIGSNNVYAGSDPDVTVQSDGVYIARAFAQFTDFVDIQRIEVLRGPQGTLYGRNAVGGTINIISRPVSDDFHGTVQLTGGDYGLAEQQSYINAPILGDKLQASLATDYIRHDDYNKNIVPGKSGSDNANRGGVRGQLRFTPNDRVEAITRVDYTQGDEHVQTFENILAPISYAPLATSTIGNDHRIALDTPSANRTKLWGIAEEINFKINDALSLKSLTAFRRSQYDLLADQDGTEIPGGTTAQAEVSKQFSQEFDLTLNLGPLSAVGGLYYFDDRDLTNIVSFIPPSLRTPAARSADTIFAPISTALSEAGFVQGTYHLTNKLAVTVGVRYTHDGKSIDQNVERTSLNPATLGQNSTGFPFIDSQTRRYHSLTPKYGIDYQLTPAALLYASATRGFKSGGTNFSGTNPLALSFNPETIWSYEGGLKSEFLDHRIRFNVTGFKYDYKNLQVQSLIGPGLVSIGNAATANVKGVEFETTAKPFRNLLLTANYSILDARYASFPNATVPTPLIPYVVNDPQYLAASNTFNASGNRLDAAPHSSLYVGGQYDMDVKYGKVFIHADYSYQSRAYYDPSNARILSQGSYGLVDASIGFNSNDKLWGVQLVGKNLGDRDYLISFAANGIVPAGVSGAPRTVAFQVTRNF